MENQPIEKKYPYHVLEFVTAGRKRKIRKTDVVATKWLRYDKLKKKVVTRYPPPPYNEDKSKELNDALQNLSDAPDTWLSYTIKPRGKAATLKEALDKHGLLARQDTALTANSDESDTEAEKRAAELIKQNEFKTAAQAFQNSLSNNHNSSTVPKRTSGKLNSNPSTVSTHDSSGVEGTDKNGTKSRVQVIDKLQDMTNATPIRNHKVIDHAEINTKLKAILDCVETAKNDVAEIKADIKSIKTDIAKMKIAITEVKKVRTKSDKEFIGTVHQLCKKYGYNIPFKSIEELQTFNKNISENKDLRESVLIVLQSGLDSQMVLSKSIVTMLKMFLSKDVAVQCVAIRRTENKYPIKDTPFFECITVVIREQRLMCNIETLDKHLTTALSSVVSNAVQWYLPKQPTSVNSKEQKSSSKPQPQTQNSKEPTSSASNIRVVAVEQLTQPALSEEDIDQLTFPRNEIYFPFPPDGDNDEIVEEVVTAEITEELHEDFNEDYLCKLNFTSE